MADTKVSGHVTDNPKIAEQVDHEVSIKTPEQAAYAEAEAAIRAERIAKNKAHAAADAYEAQQPEGGAYADLSRETTRLQELSSAGRSAPAPTEEEVDKARADAKAAAEAAEKVFKDTSVSAPPPPPPSKK